MQARVLGSGRYTILATTRGRRLLVLDGEQWLEWVRRADGESLLEPSPGREKADVARTGAFILLGPESEPGPGRTARLFLQDGAAFQEFLLPQGLPSGGRAEVQVVPTGDALVRDELRRYFGVPMPFIPAGARMLGRGPPSSRASRRFVPRIRPFAARAMRRLQARRADLARRYFPFESVVAWGRSGGWRWRAPHDGHVPRAPGAGPSPAWAGVTRENPRAMSP